MATFADLIRFNSTWYVFSAKYQTFFVKYVNGTIPYMFFWEITHFYHWQSDEWINLWYEWSPNTTTPLTFCHHPLHPCKQTGYFAVTAVLTTSLLGPEASPDIPVITEVMSFFPEGFAAQCRMLSPRWWLAQVRCAWAFLWTIYLSHTHVPCFPTGQKGARHKPFAMSLFMWCLWSLLCTSGMLLQANCVRLCFSSYLQLGLWFQWFSAQNSNPAQSTNALLSNSTVNDTKQITVQLLVTCPNIKRDQSTHKKNG